MTTKKPSGTMNDLLVKLAIIGFGLLLLVNLAGMIMTVLAFWDGK